MSACSICKNYAVCNTCNVCGFVGCQNCSGLHKDSCKIFVERKIHICTAHRELIKGYCVQCHSLTCKECVIDSHVSHTIIPLHDAVCSIIQDRDSIIEDIKTKVAEKRRLKDDLCDKQKQINDITKYIKEEADRLHQIVAEKETCMQKQVAESEIKIQKSCEAADKVILSLKSMQQRMAFIGTNQLPIMFLDEWTNHKYVIDQDNREQRRNGILKDESFDNKLDAQRCLYESISQYTGIQQSTSDSWTSRTEETHTLPMSEYVNVELPEIESVSEKRCLEDQSPRSKTENIAKHSNQMLSDLASKTKQINYIIGLLDDLPSLVNRIDNIQFKSEKDKLQLPRMKDTIMDKCTEQIEQLLNEMIRLKQDLFKKCQSMAKWTTDETKDREIQMASYVQKINNEKEQNAKLRSTIYHFQQNLKGKEAKHFNEDIHQLHLRLKQFQDEVKTKDLEMASWRDAFTDLHNLLETKEKYIQKVTTEKHELQSRLSSIAGDKLTQGNPAITDLSDPNRPMRIGEMFSELYDNESTDAVESCTVEVKRLYPYVDNSQIEEIVIRHLHKILTFTYNKCIQLSQDQQFNIAKILYPESRKGDMMSNNNSLKGIMTLQRQNAQYFIEWFIRDEGINSETVAQDWDYPYKHIDFMNVLLQTPYYKKCVHLCWSMVVQDPMMCLDDEIIRGTQFDKNLYKEFLHSGVIVRYVVWPALFLHKDGPLLQKGVIQTEKVF